MKIQQAADRSESHSHENERPLLSHNIFMKNDNYCKIFWFCNGDRLFWWGKADENISEILLRELQTRGLEGVHTSRV